MQEPTNMMGKHSYSKASMTTKIKAISFMLSINNNWLKLYSLSEK